jgi:class 3 adenylate cyclase/tetratricopeptide (TPR) repeat protein
MRRKRRELAALTSSNNRSRGVAVALSILDIRVTVARRRLTLTLACGVYDRLVPRCASCGQENPSGARFCFACGSRLDLPRVAGEERKIVTVLFADVTGSTELGDRLDAEELREVMSAWYQAMRSEIEAQGGTVEKYIGDAVMAVFGVPVSHEDDPARALRAALAIRDRLVVLNRELAASHGVGIEIRTGVNTGEAMTTLDPPPGEAMVTGVAVNAAARLEQLADPGQTLVAERTARSAPGFRFEDLGLLQVRGMQERVRAFALVAAAPELAKRGLPGVEAPLVGRERELDLLTALQERVVVERRPHLVTIYGDPGVGKSRLVGELLQRLSAGSEAPRIVTGRCLSYGEGITYWPLAEMLKDLTDVADDDPTEIVVERIKAVVTEALGSDSAAPHGLIGAALAFTLGLDSGDPEFARLQPSAVHVELHRAWRTLLSALTEERPLVVVVDDIHWADRALLDLLEEVAERVQGPLLLVCTARPELTDRHPTWGGGRRSISGLFLGPLSTDAARVLVMHLLDVDLLPEKTRAQILERAEGNPFFLEEILRHLIDEGGIVRAGDRWTATDELVQVELPDTVQAVLAARIDLLEPREKRTLQQASVVGRVFWSGAVAALVDDPEGLDSALRRLEERELVATRSVSSLVGEEEFAFKHILTRDVAYATLPRRERPSAHARAAAWIEDSTGDRRAEFVGLLAHHYAQAYRGARLDRSFDAGELEVLRIHAFESLLEGSHVALRGAGYARARALAESALDFATAPAEQATALEALGHGHSYAAMGDGAWRCYSQAADTLVESGSNDGERIARLCGSALETVCRWTGTLHTIPPESAALPYLELGIERATGDGEGRVRLLIAESFWGRTYPETSLEYRDSRLAREAGQSAAAMAERIGRPDLAVVALDAVQDSFQQELRYRESNAVSLRRLNLARSAGDLSELGDSYAVAAWSAVYLGSFRDARLIAQEGYELLRIDAPVRATHALSWGALAAFHLGDWDELLADLDRVREGLGERADAPVSGYASPWPAAAFVHEARGDRSASDRLLDQVYAIERERGLLSSHLSPLVARTLILRGDLAAARRRLDELLERERGELPFLLAAKAELLLQEERWSELQDFAESLRLSVGHSGARMLAPIADRLSGRAALAANEPSDALRLLDAAASGFATLEMAVDAAVARLDVAEALFELGRRADARRSATDACEALERVGYLQALARATASLSRPAG